MPLPLFVDRIRTFILDFHPTLTPLWTAVLQSAVIACVSNTVAQSLDAYRKDLAFINHFSFITLLRFLALDLITAPPNYKWQEFLEYRFPARPEPGRSKRHKHNRSDVYEAVPLEEREWRAEEGTLGKHEDPSDDEEIMPARTRHSNRRQTPRTARPTRPPLSWRNTLIKWFTDCITLGAVFNTLAFLIIMGVLKLQPPSKIAHNIKTEALRIIWNGYKLWPIANMIAHTMVPWEKKIVWFAFVGLCWNVYLSLVAIRL